MPETYVANQYVKEIIEQLGINIEYNSPFDYPEIVKMYQNKLVNEKEIDFHDILNISYELISDKTFITENIAGIIRSVLVDEYQDTNELQYNILSSIVKADKKIQVTFVGDTDQAINNKPLRYQTDETKKLLYVVCSRAKKNLYLFSEQGRTTKKGWELPPTKEIESVAYMYDME